MEYTEGGCKKVITPQERIYSSVLARISELSSIQVRIRTASRECGRNSSNNMLLVSRLQGLYARFRCFMEYGNFQEAEKLIAEINQLETSLAAGTRHEPFVLESLNMENDSAVVQPMIEETRDNVAYCGGVEGTSRIPNWVGGEIC